MSAPRDLGTYQGVDSVVAAAAALDRLDGVFAPGRIDTERVRFLDEKHADAAGVPVAEQRERMAATIPLARSGDAAEVGRVGAFLLSAAASYVTGAAIQVDGGYVTPVP